MIWWISSAASLVFAPDPLMVIVHVLWFPTRLFSVLMLTLNFSLSVRILFPCFLITNLAFSWVFSILCILMSSAWGCGSVFVVICCAFSLMACAMICPPRFDR